MKRSCFSIEKEFLTDLSQNELLYLVKEGTLYHFKCSEKSVAYLDLAEKLLPWVDISLDDLKSLLRLAILCDLLPTSSTSS